jgi:hypothetical protein
MYTSPATCSASVDYRPHLNQMVVGIIMDHRRSGKIDGW